MIVKTKYSKHDGMKNKLEILIELAMKKFDLDRDTAIRGLQYFKWDLASMHESWWSENSENDLLKAGVIFFHSCLICKKRTNLKSLECEHKYCQNCWMINLKDMVANTQNNILKCIKNDCCLIVSESFIEKLTVNDSDFYELLCKFFYMNKEFKNVDIDCYDGGNENENNNSIYELAKKISEEFIERTQVELISQKTVECPTCKLKIYSEKTEVFCECGECFCSNCFETIADCYCSSNPLFNTKKQRIDKDCENALKQISQLDRKIYNLSCAPIFESISSYLSDYIGISTTNMNFLNQARKVLIESIQFQKFLIIMKYKKREGIEATLIDIRLSNLIKIFNSLMSEIERMSKGMQDSSFMIDQYMQSKEKIINLISLMNKFISQISTEELKE